MMAQVTIRRTARATFATEGETTMSGGFRVQIEALRGYQDNLAAFKEQSQKFDELVTKADVSDEAWGLVGLATKSQYTAALTELRGLLRKMQEGLDQTASKIGRAADIYASEDERGAILLGKQKVEIDKVEEVRAGN